MSDPAVMSQLSADEVLAVQEMRKRKAQGREEKEAALAWGKFSPETLAIVDRVCEICEKMDREAEAAKKQHATGPGSCSASF
jgi:hypothetical protein